MHELINVREAYWLWSPAKFRTWKCRLLRGLVGAIAGRISCVGDAFIHRRLHAFGDCHGKGHRTLYRGTWDDFYRFILNLGLWTGDGS